MKLTETDKAILLVMLDNHKTGKTNMTEKDIINKVIEMSDSNPALKAELDAAEEETEDGYDSRK